jgi:hypothetical protein
MPKAVSAYAFGERFLQTPPPLLLLPLKVRERIMGTLAVADFCW